MHRHGRKVRVAVPISHRERIQSRPWLTSGACPSGQRSKSMTNNTDTTADGEIVTPEDCQMLADAMKLAGFPEVKQHEIVTWNADTREFTIVHRSGDRTEIRLDTRENGDLVISGLIRYRTSMPDLTPADDVCVTTETTFIVHGPGYETRVIHE